MRNEPRGVTKGPTPQHQSPIATDSGERAGSPRVASESGAIRSCADPPPALAALAPFVEPDGELIWYVEDGSLWRWSFDGDRLTTSVGRMVFE